MVGNNKLILLLCQRVFKRFLKFITFDDKYFLNGFVNQIFNQLLTAGKANIWQFATHYKKRE